MHSTTRMSSSADSTTKHTDSPGIQEAVTDAPDVTVVHCTADSSSITMSRRQQVVQAVRKPVSTGSRQCVNLLKELLPQEVLHEIHQQVSSGVKPLQAVESVTQQRMGPQVAADVTKLFMAVSLASSAGGGVVTATKAVLCLLAAPLYLGGPMRALTNILLPTPVAGGLLGCCIVLHTARELMANESQQQKGEAHTTSPSSSAAAADAVDAAADSSSGGSSSNVKRRNRPWWARWQRNSRQRVEQSAAEAQASHSPPAAAAGGPAAAAAGEDECATAAAERAQSPEGPCTPDAHSVLCSKVTAAVSSSADKGSDPDAAADAAAAAAAVTSGAFVKHGHGAEAHPLPSANLLSLDTYDDADVTVTAAVTNNVTNSDADNSNGTIRFKQPKQQQPAPLPLSPTNSLQAALGGLRTPPPAAAAAAHNSSTLPYQVQLRRRSSSGAADLSGEPLSPTSSGAYSPREDIEGQAAEVQRRWSMGHHDDMIPDLHSFRMLQDQPYRPPVFTRLSSGRGGCRITAAAAAAAAKQQQQQQGRLFDSGSGASEGGLRRYHSLDIKRGAEAAEQPQQQQQQGKGGSAAAAAAAAAPAGAEGWGISDNALSAPLPPLPGAVHHGSSHEHLHGGGSGELPLLSMGVVRQRSLDWGHKLCKTDST